MREIADGVHLLTGFPPHAVNCYLVGDVLVDAMGRPDAGRILKELVGSTVATHALTHAHPPTIRAPRMRSAPHSTSRSGSTPRTPPPWRTRHSSGLGRSRTR